MPENLELQGLEFQIVNDSSQAVRGLEKLSKTLENLKTDTRGGISGVSSAAKAVERLSKALSNVNASETGQKVAAIRNAVSSLQGLSGVTIPKALTARFSELNIALNGMSIENINKLASFGTGLNALSRVGDVKISSSISNQLAAINTTLANLKWTDGDKLTALADGLRPLTELGRANLTTFINQLSKLPKVIEDLEAADIAKFTQQMKDLAAAMKPFADEMQKVSNGFSAFPSKIQKLITSTNRYNSTVDRATTRTNAWGAALGGIKLTTVWYAAKRMGSALANYMYDASEWEGIMYRFGRAMGEAALENYEWIRKLNSEMYINVQQFMQYSSIFGTMLKGYGVATEDAAKMAMNYTELTYDIWAGYNDVYTSFEDAAVAVRSAIAGEVEPIRKAGFTIVDSQLKVTAANYGLAYSSQKASEELKSYLRYLTLVDQAKAQDLIGTYAKEMSTAEGLMRTLRQQVTSLAQAFGSFLLPVLVKVLPYVQAIVEQLGRLIVALAGLLGFTINPVDFSNGLSAGVGAAEDMTESLNDAADAAKKLKKSVLGFDELNILSAPATSSAAGSAGGPNGSYAGMFDIEKIWDDAIFEDIQTQVDEVAQKLKNLLVVIGLVGSGIAAWKIGSKLNLNLEKTLALGVGIFGAFILVKNILDAIVNGVTTENLNGMIFGMTLAITGLYVALGPVAGAIAAIASGLAVLAMAFLDANKNGWNFQNTMLGVAGLLATGLGISLLVGSAIPLFIGAIAALLLTIVTATGHGEELINGVKDMLGGFIDFFAGIFTGDIERATNGIDRILSGLKTVIGSIIAGIRDWLNGLLDWIDEKTGGKLKPIITGIKRIVTVVFTQIKETVGNIIDDIRTIFKGLIKFLTGVFTLDFDKAWEGIKEIFKGVWNVIIDLLNGAINIIISGLNWVIRQLNKISFDVPDWVPGIGGKSVGVNISYISENILPRLAKGAVIPANNEFLAVLGDQKRGTNIEAPEDLIRKIVREESNSGELRVTIVLDSVTGKKIFDTVVRENNAVVRATGASPLLT